VADASTAEGLAWPWLPDEPHVDVAQLAPSHDVRRDFAAVPEGYGLHRDTREPEQLCDEDLRDLGRLEIEVLERGEQRVDDGQVVVCDVVVFQGERGHVFERFGARDRAEQVQVAPDVAARDVAVRHEVGHAEGAERGLRQALADGVREEADALRALHADGVHVCGGHFEFFGLREDVGEGPLEHEARQVWRRSEVVVFFDIDILKAELLQLQAV